MFTPDQVKAIRQLAATLQDEIPSKSVLEGIVDKANTWTLEALCMEIDALATSEKLAAATQDNPARAKHFKALMCRFPEPTAPEALKHFDLCRCPACQARQDLEPTAPEGLGASSPARRQRAAALRYVNKLRGQSYWEPPQEPQEA